MVLGITFAVLSSSVALGGTSPPPVNRRFCEEGHDYTLRNGEPFRSGLSSNLCMDGNQWFHRDEMPCCAGPVCPCNVTGEHDVKIVNRTHRGRITPTAPGEFKCTVTEIPLEQQCLGPYQDADDCMEACGSDAKCCKDPAQPQYEGTCYKVGSCDELTAPACATQPYTFLLMDANVTFQSKVDNEELGSVDHWMSERWSKKREFVGLMHYYLRGDSKPAALIRTAFEQRFDKRPGDGGSNITQLGIRDWSKNYTTNVPDTVFVPDAEAACEQAGAMALQV